MLTIRSLIWTVQPGLKREKPSAISLMVCEPADWGGAGNGAGGAGSRAAMMANHRTILLSSPHPKRLRLSQSDIRVHWSVNIYQQIKTERGNFSALESSSPRRVCGKTRSEYLCVFSQWQQPNRKHSSGPSTSEPTGRPWSGSLVKGDDWANRTQRGLQQASLA